MKLEREKARARGTAGEWLAALWLLAHGYRILARQYRAQGGELDIVALSPFWSERTLVFVEVRARASRELAADSVGVSKQMRVEAAARQFLARKPKLARLPCRFDIVVLAPGRMPQHLVDAWRA